MSLDCLKFTAQKPLLGGSLFPSVARSTYPDSNKQFFKQKTTFERSRMQPLRIFLHFLVFNFVISAKDTSFVFNGFHNADLSLSGGSYVKADGVLAVTNDTGRILGHAFYPEPLHFKYNSTRSADVLSFSTTFVFSLRPKYPNLGGHGLAFLFSSTAHLKGAQINQYLGLPNMTSNANFNNHILAVEFDMVQNLELGDINDNHVGIDMNSLISNVSQPAAYISGNRSNNNQTIDFKSGVSVQAWVEYSSKEKLLNVTISPFREPRPSLPLISFPVDLSTVFDEYMNVGFSASTGLLAAEHNVLGWSFRLNGPAQELDPSELPSLSPPKSNIVNSKGFALGIALAGTAFVLLGILASYQILQRLKNGDEDQLEDWEVEYGARRYDYSELSAATRGFGDKNLVGSGGFGSVYRGVIPSTGLEAAIKRISHDSRQGMKEFVAEIISVGRLRHRNLVQLHGWCRRRDELLLVYDYVPNGSLDKLLFNPKKLLTWDQRFKILKGVAQALLYLHEECDQRVVHRDIKSSNILIDADLNAKLGDFGLARIYEHDIHPQTTHIVGTLGYLAPELTRTGKATTNTDVFSYGALALEVACGRRPIEPQSNAFELVLVDWIKELYRRGEVMKAVDPRLDRYDREEMELILNLGLLCSHPLPCYRPSMRRVVQFLLGDATLPPLPPDIHQENYNVMGEFSDSYVDSSDPSSYRVTSSKSTSSLSSFDGKGRTMNVAHCSASATKRHSRVLIPHRLQKTQIFGKCSGSKETEKVVSPSSTKKDPFNSGARRSITTLTLGCIPPDFFVPVDDGEINEFEPDGRMSEEVGSEVESPRPPVKMEMRVTDGDGGHGEELTCVRDFCREEEWGDEEGGEAWWRTSGRMTAAARDWCKCHLCFERTEGGPSRLADNSRSCDSDFVVGQKLSR
ncbi:hypothetical protein H6P81_001356 [Aristolochia fimbriata]|uniref:non-specific serine/threonine protein kinase n=1 Tax=Aristolochia fimbriata TaxID=158543 RepID=A0AAV7F6Z4_ARIFI|nr:hypothetical protein H6P81_001356 [Aristolochia fimbriata]